MNTTSPANHCFEFYFPERDTLLRVEEADGAVTIRATRDSFSDTRKSSFVRELAAEGFIPDNYQWFSQAEPGAFLGVHWLVDVSWLTLPESALAWARRFMRRILFGGCLVWLGLMVALFQGWLGNGASFTAAKTHSLIPLSAHAHPTSPTVGSRLRGALPAR